MHVFLIAAVTADGFIGRATEHSSFDWTSQEDKQFYVNKIKESRAIVMGSSSFKTFTRYPKDVHYVIYTRTPQTFVNPKPERIKAEGTNEDPKALIQRLEKERYSQVAIAGGASIYTQFMKAGVVDTLYLTMEPVFFGQGVKLFNEPLDVKVKLVKSELVGEQTVLNEFRIIR